MMPRRLNATLEEDDAKAAECHLGRGDDDKAAECHLGRR